MFSICLRILSILSQTFKPRIPDYLDPYLLNLTDLADSYLEFIKPDKNGDSIYERFDIVFDKLRRDWRHGEQNLNVFENVNFHGVDFIDEYKKGTLETVSLPEFSKSLVQSWMKNDRDYPSDEKLKSMNIEDLTMGHDWKWKDN